MKTNRNLLLMMSFLFFVILIAIITNFQINDTTYNLENTAVSIYMKDVNYSENSKDSVISNYVDKEYKGNDQPSVCVIPVSNGEIFQLADNSKFIDIIFETEIKDNKVNLINLIPGEKYYYRIYKQKKVVQKGEFYTSGRIRMLSIDGIYNIRDIGGWMTTDGKAIKYGLIIRGSEMDGNHGINISKKGISQMLDLGIMTEIDLRTDAEIELNVDISKLGDMINYVRVPIVAYMGIAEEHNDYYKVFQNIFKSVKEDKPIYIHCWGGADRTGTVIALIEGLIGVKKEDIYKDYELTSFSIFGTRAIDSDAEGFLQMINYIDGFEGSTFKERCYSYFISMGFSTEELDDFCERMVEY